MHSVQSALIFFRRFHRGRVNTALHLIGFAGVFASLWMLDWRGFAAALLILESGHIYNHLRGIEIYDLRLKILMLRLAFFLLFVGLVVLLTRFLR